MPLANFETGLKVCSKCREEKPLSEFRKSTGSDGFHSWCKACGNEAQRKRCAENPELVRAQRRKSFMKDPERHREYWRKWRKKNPEKVRQIGRESDAKRRREKPVDTKLDSAKNRARKLGIGYNLTGSDVSIPKVCPVLGIPLVLGNGKREAGSPSLDRIDNGRGYVRGNVQFLSWRANRLKSDGTAEEHRRIADYMDMFS